MPLALAPALGNPVSLLSAGMDGTAAASVQVSQLLTAAAQLLRLLPTLADLLPPETLAWKLNLLARGNEASAAQLSGEAAREWGLGSAWPLCLAAALWMCGLFVAERQPQIPPSHPAIPPTSRKPPTDPPTHP
jgi:hypothetical protein